MLGSRPRTLRPIESSTIRTLLTQLVPTAASSRPLRFQFSRIRMPPQRYDSTNPLRCSTSLPKRLRSLSDRTSSIAECDTCDRMSRNCSSVCANSACSLSAFSFRLACSLCVARNDTPYTSASARKRNELVNERCPSSPEQRGRNYCGSPAAASECCCLIVLSLPCASATLLSACHAKVDL